MTVAATDVQKNISGVGPCQTSHKREAVFEETLRVTVLLRGTR
ncbi:MAG: hypothetical protein WAO08_31155 [Hyphomicrobiaceae bacterium]